MEKSITLVRCDVTESGASDTCARPCSKSPTAPDHPLGLGWPKLPSSTKYGCTQIYQAYASQSFLPEPNHGFTQIYQAFRPKPITASHKFIWLRLAKASVQNQLRLHTNLLGLGQPKLPSSTMYGFTQIYQAQDSQSFRPAPSTVSHKFIRLRLAKASVQRLHTNVSTLGWTIFCLAPTVAGMENLTSTYCNCVDEYLRCGPAWNGS